MTYANFTASYQAAADGIGIVSNCKQTLSAITRQVEENKHFASARARHLSGMVHEETVGKTLHQ